MSENQHDVCVWW